ncbi:MAG: hypothetical protein WD397_16235 [Wenzhouxiangellaceae bacterium]
MQTTVWARRLHGVVGIPMLEQALADILNEAGFMNVLVIVGHS